MPKYVAVLIDHTEARIFDIRADPSRHHHAAQETTLEAPQHKIHRHPRGHDGEGHEHPEDAVHFFQAIRLQIADADGLLVLGPSSAKHELVAYLEKHDSALARKVIGIEAVDHPTDKQVIALASDTFLKFDRLEGRS